MTTVKNEFKFKVNGKEFSTDKEVLTASEILAMAKDAGVLPGGAGEYVLSGKKGKYQGDEQIDLRNPKDNDFIAVPTGPTPVA